VSSRRIAPWSESLLLGTTRTRLFLIPGRFGGGTNREARNFRAAGSMHCLGSVILSAVNATSDVGSGLKHPAGSELLVMEELNNVSLRIDAG
jgi:hypothetical protein